MDAANLAVSVARRFTRSERASVVSRPNAKLRPLPQVEVARTTAPTFSSDEERLTSFQRSLDALRERVEASLGEADVAHIKGVRRLSRRLEIAGRTLIHVKPTST